MPTFHIYPAEQDAVSDTKLKRRISSAVWSNINAGLICDKQIQKFEAIASKTGSTSANKVVEAIRAATKIEVKTMSEQDTTSRVRITVHCRQIKHSLIDSFDNNVIAKCRRRTPSSSPEIPFVDELLQADKDIRITFTHNAKENIATLIKNHSKNWNGKSLWLENILEDACSKMNDNIWFAINGGNENA